MEKKAREAPNGQNGKKKQQQRQIAAKKETKNE